MAAMTLQAEKSQSHETEYVEKLIKLGFKPVPIKADGQTPAIEWTPIYEDANYWTPEKLVEQADKFDNIATTFGKVIIDGEVWCLHCLDIDSEEVYKTLLTEFPESFVNWAMKHTWVTKTHKHCGRHIYWLERLPHKQIETKDCKPGYEFEIFTEKHLAALSGRHRDDPNFHYVNWGIEAIMKADGMYDKMVEVLGECLKAFDNTPRTRRISIKEPVHFNTLTAKKVKLLLEIILPRYRKSYRNSLCMSLAGFFRKSGIPESDTLTFIDRLCSETHDEERASRLDTVRRTYLKPISKIKGYTGLEELLR